MKREIKSYVLRAGRVTSRQQHGLEVCLPLYQIQAHLSVPWSMEEIFKREAETVVEIGFGMGASLVTQAKQTPELNFIGIEVHRAGVGSLAAALSEEALSNVRIIEQDACEIFNHYIPDNSLYRIQIFFPDPWPKKRHHKRRLIQPAFVSMLVKKLKTGGTLHCATDWENYAEHIHQVLMAESRLENLSIHSDYVERPSYRPLTKFENRGKKLGHEVFDLIFMKK